MDPAAIVFGLAIFAIPAILVLAVLSMFGSLVTALADGQFAIGRSPHH